LKKFERELVRGYLHEPEHDTLGKGLVLTHGAGANCESPLMKAVAEEFCRAGFHVLRFDLPFRQQKPKGPPFPALAGRDREGLRNAVAAMREITPNYVAMGGHSYGGRQASMLAAESPGLADALLLLAYPLHPPHRQDQMRTAHFPQLRTPALFVHGAPDGFATLEELLEAMRLIPVHTEWIELESGGHALKPEVAKECLQRFLHSKALGGSGAVLQ